MQMLKIPFLRLGQWVHPVYGLLTITQQTFDEMVRNFQANVLGCEPFVRIGHEKDGKMTFGDAPAEGWVKNITQEGDVLCALVEPTTEAAAENIRRKRYRFSSAEFTQTGVNRETGQAVGALLSAIALTNQPFLTRLPEATLLAALPDQFFLDFQLKEGIGMEELLKKLLEMLQSFISGHQTETEAIKQQQAEANKALATMNEQLQNQLKLSQQQAAIAEQARRLAEVEKQGAELVALGIPPMMVDTWKALAGSEDGRKLLKLADGQGGQKEVSQADAMKEMLLALPEAHRIPLGQRGTQSTGDEKEKIKLACDADILAMGGTVTADGKYQI